MADGRGVARPVDPRALPFLNPYPAPPTTFAPLVPEETLKRVLLGAILSALVCLPASAQPETVPRELALRLLGIYGEPSSGLYVGRLPPGDRRFARLPLPENARVLGSSSTGDRQFSLSSVYLNVTGTVEDALRFYSARLPRAGWERQVRSGQAGFLADTASFPASRGFCRGDTVLDVSARRRAGVVQVDLGMYRADPSYSPCSPAAAQGPPEPPLPPLRPPAGSRTLNVEPAYAQYEGFGTPNIALGSDLSALEVRASYDRQLSEAGWQPQADGQDGPVTWSQWTFRARGAAWSGLLNVVSDPAFPNRHLAQLLVVRR